MSERRKLVERDVRADDPRLSREANELLTSELREAVGEDRTEVPADRAESAGRLGSTPRPTMATVLGANRLLIGITLAALIVVGVIVSLITHNWWAVVAAAAVHAIATLTVVQAVIRMSTQVEHVAPGTAARLVEEGVSDPDRALGELVENYTADDQAHGAAETVSSGHNRVTTEPADAPLTASVEQRTAMTPAGTPTEPAGLRGAPLLLPILAVAGSVVVGVVIAIFAGGAAWIGAGLLVASSVAWLLLQMHMAGQAEEDDATGDGRPDRTVGDSATGRRTLLLPTVAIVTAAVIAGVIIIGAIGGYL